MKSRYEAAEAAFAQSRPREHNFFKVQLGKLTLIRALRQAASMEFENESSRTYPRSQYG